jgi:hypothetical protein
MFLLLTLFLPYDKTITTICHFSGIFFVESFAENVLSCKAIDSEAEDVVEVPIRYWFPSREPHPFQKLYENVTAGKVYEI